MGPAALDVVVRKASQDKRVALVSEYELNLGEREKSAIGEKGCGGGKSRSQ